MTTTVIKTIDIGGGKDYSSLQSWHDGIGANMTTTRAGQTLQAGSTTANAVLDAGASAVDAFYTGLTITVSGEERLITGYTGATKTATIGVLNGSSATWSSAPSAGTAYTINAIAAEGRTSGAEFTLGSTILTISGNTTSASSTITLTTAAGQSAWDTNTNPLTYDVTKGVGFRATGGSYYNFISSTLSNIFFSKLQIKTPAANGLISMSVQSSNISQCLIEGADTRAGLNDGVVLCGTISNSVVITKTTSTTNYCIRANGNVANCTIIRAGTGANNGCYASYANPAVKNCAFFGAFGNNLNIAHGTMTYSYCATDNAAWGTTGTGGTLTDGGNNLVSKTFANQFVSTTVNFQLKAGADCLNAGTTDTTDIPAANDIYGTARPQGSAWDIGAHELIVASAVVPVLYMHRAQQMAA